jgi:hypothetical protein
MKANKVSAMAGTKRATSSFQAGGRGSFSTTSFARPKSIAASWAESQMQSVKQEPLWTLGIQVTSLLAFDSINTISSRLFMQNELLLTRPRYGISRIKTSRRNKASSPENFQIQIQSTGRPVSSMSLYASKRSDSANMTEHEMSRSATPFDGDSVANRRL